MAVVMGVITRCNARIQIVLIRLSGWGFFMVHDGLLRIKLVKQINSIKTANSQHDQNCYEQG
jgi:hypothetical protein